MELLTTKIKVDSGESLFLKTIAAQGHTGSTLVATFASNSGAMVAGYKSKVLGIDYEVTAGNVPDLTQDQMITIGNETFVLQPAIDPDTKLKNKPKAPALKFEVGARTMTLGLLQQGQAKTIITFKGFEPNNYVKKATELTQDDLVKFIGSTFECTNYYRDNSNEIVRNNPDGSAGRKYAANVYEITITKA